jgi:hypothetical protein
MPLALSTYVEDKVISELVQGEGLVTLVASCVCFSDCSSISFKPRRLRPDREEVMLRRGTVMGW